MGRAHLFSTALNPGSVGAALAALKIVQSDEGRELRETVMELGNWMRNEIKALGLETPSTMGPIVPVIVGAETAALEASAALLERGFYVPAIRFPTVKRGGARLRISVSAAHDREDCERLLRELRAVFKDRKGVEERKSGT